jgi:hypothetical protein
MLLKRFLWPTLLVASLAAPATAQQLLAPMLKYVGQFPDAGLIQFNLAVMNWQAYSPALFSPSPDLPPCGTNAAASRTWVDVFDARTDQRIVAVCAFGAPIELTKISFATPPAAKPKTVYIVLTDRLLKRTVVSNKVAIP